MSNIDYKGIGLKIKQKRKSMNITQKELAEIAGLTESSISRYESGRIQTLPTSTINKICNILDIDPGELLGLSPENSFKFDLIEILNMVDDLPADITSEFLDIFKKQISVYRRVYEKNNNNLLEEVKK